jgi:hypothetical protein
MDGHEGNAMTDTAELIARLASFETIRAEKAELVAAVNGLVTYLDGGGDFGEPIELTLNAVRAALKATATEGEAERDRLRAEVAAIEAWTINRCITVIDADPELGAWTAEEKKRIAAAIRSGAELENPKTEIDALRAQKAELVEALQDCLREHGGYTIRGECERKARAALAKAVQS